MYVKKNNVNIRVNLSRILLGRARKRDLIRFGYRNWI